MADQKTKLGELKEQVLLTLLRLDGESYAVPVANELVRVAGREVSPATAYMVMRRLEENGLLVSSVGTSDPERGGRPRRFYRVVEEAALPLLRQSRESMLALWEGLEPRLGAS
jgi:DNA-binding PadR family transcriptional regulator